MGSQAELGNHEDHEVLASLDGWARQTPCQEGTHETPIVSEPLVPKLRLGMPVEKLCFFPYLFYQSVTTLISPSCPA